MTHLMTVTRERVVVAKAESILVKHAQLEVLAQAVAITGDVVELVKGDNGGSEEEQ